MSSSLTETLAAEIRGLHDCIVRSLRRTVDDAIKIGELLVRARASLPHGEYMEWVAAELPFSQRTADNYRHLYEYRAKIATVANLQEAYQVVAAIETEEKQKARRARVEPQETVVDADPRGPVDPPRHSRAELPPETKAEVRSFGERMRREDTEARENAARSTTSRAEVDDLLRRVAEYLAQAREAAERFSRLTLAGDADNEVQSSMLGLLKRYVMSFETPSRRAEVAHNLIKALRLLVHEVREEEAV
jgi:rubrerythrin